MSITITNALFLLVGTIRGSAAKRKMDNILDACFDEELFNVPLRHSKKKREKRIESHNPWKYAETLIPIYENHKVDKDEITELDCRASHEIALDDKTIPEEDRLYNFFASLCGQDRKFMCTWLHLFVRLHKRYFTTLASNYFKRKGLTLENWLDSVHDGRKSDVLALLSLCMLVEKRVLVHLHNNQIWTSLKDSISTWYIWDEVTSRYYKREKVHCK